MRKPSIFHVGFISRVRYRATDKEDSTTTDSCFSGWLLVACCPDGATEYCVEIGRILGGSFEGGFANREDYVEYCTYVVECPRDWESLQEVH